MLLAKAPTITDMLAIVRRRAWLVAIPPVLTLFAALLYTSRIPDVYQADMLIAVDPQRVPDEIVRSTVTLGTDRRLDAISVQVLSRTNLEKMIEDLDLYPQERAQLSIEDVVSRMRSSINVEMDRGRGQAATSFHVRFTHMNPEVAAKVTQQLGTLFVEQNAQDRGSLAQATNVFLASQLAEARKELVGQERKLEAFRQLHGHSLPTQTAGNLQALQNMQLQLQSHVESMARDRDRKLVLERLYRDALSESGTARAGTDGSRAGGLSAREQLAAARNQLAGLELKYTASHPDVVRARRLIAELEPKAAEEEKAAERARASMAAAPDSLQSVPDVGRRQQLREMLTEIESIDRRLAFKEADEGRLRKEIADYQARIEAVPGLESEWVALSRDYDTLQGTYEDLLRKSESAKVAAALEDQKIGEHFRIVDAARVPVRPLPSMRPRINIAGLALGLILGIGIAAFLEFRDASFRTESDIFEVLALPVLATIPFVETSRESRRRKRRMGVVMAAGALCVAALAYVGWVEQVWKGLQ